jgi:undecaprenyl-diphosphatase
MRRLFTATLAWIGSRGGLFLSVILLIVAGVWAFIVLADSVRERETERFDSRINRFCYEHHGPKWLADAGRDVTALGGVTVLALFIAAVVGYLLLSSRYGMAGLVVVATLGGLGVTSVLKHWIDRPRPPLHQSDAVIYTTSFPSGHSALSAATYLTLGTLLARSTRSRRLRFYFLTLALIATGLVGLSRIYLGAHYPTDVLAGWCVGLVWALICWAVARELQYRRVVEPPNDEEDASR